MLIFCCLTSVLAAQDSIRRVAVFDRTLIIPVSLQQHTEASGAGYITDGIDTLYYRRHMAIVPMYVLQMERICDEHDKACAEQNARIRKYNDSICKIDPRVGTYHECREHGDEAWYYALYPKAGIYGKLSLEIDGENKRTSFLLWTTTVDPDRQAMWKRVLESIN